ncbi:MAG: TadE family protein [Paracoccaceae bacterium]
MIRRVLSRLTRAFRREDGTASIEFVIFVPVVVTIFMASVEAGFFMAKHVMMERGLDMVMRDLRLGKLGAVDHNSLRHLICQATPILKDCESILKVEMRPVSTTVFDMPAVPATCIDRGNSTEPLTDFIPGGSNEIMIVRVCAVQDPIFPSTGIGLQMRKDALGGYQMIAASVFVNEPR